jgi:hypothetical protein
MPDFQLVLIEWEDSHSPAGWQTLDAPFEDRALVCRSVGWLVLDGARAKVLAPHLNNAEPGVLLQGSGIITIPTRAVLRVASLEETSPQGNAGVTASLAPVDAPVCGPALESAQLQPT